MTKNEFMGRYYRSIARFWLGMMEIFSNCCDKAIKEENYGLYNKYSRLFSKCSDKFMKNIKRSDDYFELVIFDLKT